MMIELSEQQQCVFDKYLLRQNIFITGPGGSGKSALIKYIYEDAIRKGRNIQVTALTGCAAVLLNCKAKTLHSWAGIGLGNAEADFIVEKIEKNRYKKKVWRETDILIVDEVSMMSLKLFELINLVGKEVRKSNRPFGGIQVIFSGDFYQLPPVASGSSNLEDSQFCFESELWHILFDPVNQIALKKIFRQKDEVYATILNQLREGKLKRKSYELLMSYVGKSVPEDSLIMPTKIFPTRSKVEQINSREMTKLSGDTRIFELKKLANLTDGTNQKKQYYTTEEKEQEWKYLANNLMCESVIHLKIGSQVMCIINKELDDGQILCNGSQGVVTGFIGLVTILVKFNELPAEIPLSMHTWASERSPGLGVSQLPIILAWAITIHKSQGASLDMAEIDVGSDIFECGQTYVALSRVRSLEGLFLTSFDLSKILINKKVQEFYNKL
jgi:ATP-dependent exoDNAse (exonuclease V), alpha subunit - helicase superfamily I member